jgi:hypothetical protein
MGFNQEEDYEVVDWETGRGILQQQQGTLRSAPAVGGDPQHSPALPNQQLAFTLNHTFDHQKHMALHGLLMLLGAPVSPAGPITTHPAADVTNNTAGSLSAAAAAKKRAAVPQGSGPASHVGVGAVYAIVAARMAAGAAGVDAVGAAAAARTAALLASLYPVAARVAQQVAPDLSLLMCPGAVLTSVDQAELQRRRWHRHVLTCIEGCLTLQELQLIGEVEMELTGRGQYVPVLPLQVRADMARVGLAAVAGC